MSSLERQTHLEMEGRICPPGCFQKNVTYCSGIFLIAPKRQSSCSPRDLFTSQGCGHDQEQKVIFEGEAMSLIFNMGLMTDDMLCRRTA
jgi:hypothetical protein